MKVKKNLMTSMSDLPIPHHQQFPPPHFVMDWREKAPPFHIPAACAFPLFALPFSAPHADCFPIPVYQLSGKRPGTSLILWPWLVQNK